MFKCSLVFTFLLALTSGATTSAVYLRQSLEARLQCKDLETFFWSETHQLLLDEKLPMSWEELKTAFLESQNPRIQKLSSVIQVLQKHLTDNFFQLTKSEQLEIWSQLELGVEHAEILAELKPYLEDLYSANLKKCLQAYEVPAGQRSLVNLSKGARSLMSIGYQSCEAAKLASLDGQTKSLEGVKIIRDHADKVGKVRKISNLALVQRTHPYLRIQNKEVGCFPVMDKPLIYDYGGKPAYKTAAGFEIDLFKNAGSGGVELGIDCSAFIVASLGLEGLRLKPNEDMTARNTAAVGTSTLIKSPDFFPCFDYVSIGVNQSPLMTGDIVTVSGHALIIDDVGADPLGLSHVTSENACLQLTEERFDFRVLHSSPEVGSVGMSRMQGKDYIKTSAKMRAGFLRYARNHCVFKLRNQTKKPKYADVSIVRHKKTPVCLGRALTITHQACVKGCL